LRASIRQSITNHDDLHDRKDLRDNMVEMKHAAFVASRSIYGVVLLTALPVVGITLLGLTISWNTISIELYQGMVEALKVLTIFFQSLYAIVAIFVWDGNGLLAYIDLILCIVAPFADWYWFMSYDENGVLSSTDITTFTLLTGYMTMRLWIRAVFPRHKSWKKEVQDDSSAKLDCINMVWTTRSASQVSKILPDILHGWDTLVAAWGLENARKVCRITVYVTDKDEEACRVLKEELSETNLYQSGAIQFHRADIPRIIEDHTLNLICNRHTSYSLLAFCGSPELAHDVHYHKISNDMVTAITGNKKHQMEFVSESYGGAKVTDPKGRASKKDSKAEKVLTTRKTASYFLDASDLHRRSSFRVLRDRSQRSKA
jgi:hypothetical protein